MTAITFRTDDEADRALAELMSDGTSASAAIRAALIETARRHAAQRLRAEADSLAADPDDRAEARRVLADLEPLRAW
jgi:Arc/MetJ-type ribon-helix-helix transcriptional regulator